MSRRTGVSARTNVTLSVPYHIRELVLEDADRYGGTFSGVVSTVLARHYGTTVDGTPVAKKAKRAAKAAEQL